MAIFLFGWWLVGLSGFVYWWTSEHDLKFVDLVMGFFFAVIGPLAWLLGYLIHGKESGTKTITIMKSRGRK